MSGQGDKAGAARVTVRRLTAADVVAYRIVRLESLRLAPDAFGSSHADWARQPDAAYLARIERGAIFGAFTDRGLEGLLSVDREPGSRAAHRAGVHQVYVRAALRRQGVARMLLVASRDWARDAGILQLELAVVRDNPAAMALYAGAGFVRFADWPRAVRTAAGYDDEVMMVLRLDEGGTADPEAGRVADGVADSTTGTHRAGAGTAPTDADAGADADD